MMGFRGHWRFLTGNWHLDFDLDMVTALWYTHDPNQYQDAKPQSGTSSILQSPKSGFEGHGYSFNLQNQDREPKFGLWVYQRPVTISKSISICQTPVRNLQCPPKPQIRT